MKKILLLDDNFEIVMMLRAVVAQLGYGVRSATEGEEALGLLRRETIDLVITDLRMPVMDGWQFLHAAREAGYAGRVLVLTAFPQMTEGQQVKALAVDRVLCKPIQVAEFEKELHRLLGAPAEKGAKKASPR